MRKKGPHSSAENNIYNSSHFFIIYRKEIRSYSVEQGAPYMLKKKKKKQEKATKNNCKTKS